MIRISNLKKIYRTDEVETVAVASANLRIDSGEFVAIMGPSGSGKTTLLTILGLLDSPTEGEYYFLGHEVSRYSEKQRTVLRRKNIGFVFQNFNLINELTVYENIELPLIYMGLASSERKNMVMEIMEKMRLTPRRNHFPKQLSGGQQQRAAVARAIVGKQKLILADEPTGNLDSRNGDEVMNLLAQLNEGGATVVMVTHSTEYASWANRIVQLFDGHVANENITEGTRSVLELR
ncbi:MAG: ABC transporter ATP-binding protein [Bacteroidetes bacterium]|nr:ABC transporter ATP-binding protein [Bacteroidota bacterium]